MRVRRPNLQSDRLFLYIILLFYYSIQFKCFISDQVIHILVVVVSNKINLKNYVSNYYLYFNKTDVLLDICQSSSDPLDPVPHYVTVKSTSQHLQNAIIQGARSEYK